LKHALILPLALTLTTTLAGASETLVVGQEAKLLSSEIAQGDDLGDAVAVSGDTAVVGAPWANGVGNNTGAAYVFVRSGTVWTEQAKLFASDGGSGDIFGASAAIDGDTIVVGAYQNQEFGLAAGAAYVFERQGTTWTQTAKLTASDATTAQRFAFSVSVSADSVVVGAIGDPVYSIDRDGSAYAFRRIGTTWSEEAKIVAEDGGVGDAFGISVSIEWDTLVVGSIYNAELGSDAGSAYVYRRSETTWSQQAKLNASDGRAGDGFGVSVALSGTTVLVGAIYDDLAPGVNGSYYDSEGSAYVFVYQQGAWSQQAKLSADDATDEDKFGDRVSLSGDIAVIGAYDNFELNTHSGTVYAFQRGGVTWTEQVKVYVDFPASYWLGRSVCLDGDTLLVGARSSKGASYALRLTNGPGTYCTAGFSASGCQALISAAGSPSASATSGFQLTASAVEGQKDGLFFFGTSGRQANAWGSGTSYQCVVPPVSRAGLLPSSGTTGACDGAFAQDLNGLWCPGCPKPAKNPGAGALVQAQLWYRDPLNTSNQTTSLSDALEFCVAP
jgi:hypothetical protein